MPLAVQELHREGLEYPVLIGGAAINRNFGYRALHVNGLDDETKYDPGVFYCKDAFEGLGVMDQLVEGDAREALLAKLRADADAFREKGEEIEVLDTSDDSVRSPVDVDVEVPEPPFWGVREIEVDLDEVYPHLDTHVLFKLHWGGRGVKGDAWKELVEGDFRPRLERMWREQTYLHPRALLGYFPCYSEGNTIVVLDPEDRETEIERFVCPRQPKGDRVCLADFYRPKDHPDGPDVVALQAVTVGSEVTDLLDRLHEEGEFAEQLFVHGMGVQTAEGLAEWLHYRVRQDLGIGLGQGRRYSWGYPAVPEQSEHAKVDHLLDLSRIGMSLSGGYAPMPEQSTLAIVAHHPQAFYFGSTQGKLRPADKTAPDDLIKGSKRDPSLFGAPEELAGDDPLSGGVAEGEGSGAPVAAEV
jgi:5-methyltetrahydrofolate--homocysteine methyltransferase